MKEKMTEEEKILYVRTDRYSVDSTHDCGHELYSTYKEIWKDGDLVESTWNENYFCPKCCEFEMEPDPEYEVHCGSGLQHCEICRD